jgi:integrase/recombinase XerD
MGGSMKITQKPNALARALQDFFAEHLSCLRGMSLNTIHSYRDCLVLFLRFVATQRKCEVIALDMAELDANQVMAFLQMLEDERHNSAATRNVRLAAIHVFFRYFAGRHPEQLEHCQRVLAVPFKRTRTRSIEYLEYDEIQAVLAAVDQSNKDGKRDYALLVTMFNTGTRVQEILDLR